MKDPCPSNFNTYVSVERLVTKPDGGGGQEPVSGEGSPWAHFFSFWCELDWKAGSESQNMDRTQAKDRVVMVAHWDQRLTEQMRLVLEDGSVLNVRSVNNRKQRNMWMDIEATRGDGT